MDPAVIGSAEVYLQIWITYSLAQRFNYRSDLEKQQISPPQTPRLTVDSAVVLGPFSVAAAAGDTRCYREATWPIDVIQRLTLTERLVDRSSAYWANSSLNELHGPLVCEQTEVLKVAAFAVETASLPCCPQ